MARPPTLESSLTDFSVSHGSPEPWVRLSDPVPARSLTHGAEAATSVALLMLLLWCRGLWERALCITACEGDVTELELSCCYAARDDGANVSAQVADVAEVLSGRFRLLQQDGREQFATVLDVGCGAGLTGEVFKPMARQMIGYLTDTQSTNTAAESILD